MERVQLGDHGPEVGVIGFGAWGLSGDYGAANDDESMATIRHAFNLGVTLIDTADEYGNGHNERLVGAVVRERRRDDILVATKFGLVGQGASRGVCGRPEYARTALEASLGRLGVEHVDLYYLHRVDPAVTIEETVGAMAELVDEGKVRYLGLCEVDASEIQRAHAVHAITAIQSEYSLWTRDNERDVLPCVRSLGIGFVAFAPLGRGLLAGSLTRRDEIGPNDFRYSLPRFQPGNLEQNLDLVARLRSLAASQGATPAQLALAWLVTQGVVPIPGTRTVRHLEENLASAVKLGPSDLAQLEGVFTPNAAAGDRYSRDQAF